MATARTLFIKTAAGTDTRNAQVISEASGAGPAIVAPVKLGDKETTDIYFVKGDGTYDTDVTGTLRFAVSVPGLAPTGGTFWLGFGTQTSGTLTTGKRYQIQTFVAGDVFTNVGAATNETGVLFTAAGTTPTTWTNGSTLLEITTDLSYAITAADLQTALNLLASITLAAGVTVSGESPNWLIQFNSVGSRAAMSGDGTGLLPDGQCFASEVQAGTTVVKERVHIRLLRKPFVLQNTWASITNGWRAVVDYGTYGLSDYLSGEVSRSDNLVMEVEMTDGSGLPRTYLDTPVEARNECVNPLSFVPSPLEDFYTSVETDTGFVHNQYPITGLTGGGATNLDGIATTSLVTSVLVAIKIAGAISFYRLEAGTDAESSPTVIRPDDFNAVSNAKVWKLGTLSVTDLSDYEALSFSAAGNTDVTPTAGNTAHTALISPGAGAGPYTRTVSILTANAADGCRCWLRIEMPASANPTVEIRNATSGGTLLKSIPGNAFAHTLVLMLVHDGSSWLLRKTFYESGPRFRISTAGAFQVLDDDGVTFRELRSNGGVPYYA
jgi:hypothetical protein